MKGKKKKTQVGSNYSFDIRVTVCQGLCRTHCNKLLYIEMYGCNVKRLDVNGGFRRKHKKSQSKILQFSLNLLF